MCDKTDPSPMDAANRTAKQYVDSSIFRQQQRAKQQIEAALDYRPKPYGGEASCASQVYGNYRTLIDRLIDYHNRQSTQLHALLRALPQDMSRDAEQALYDFAKTTLGNIR